jgi:hypothetical protein
MSDYDEATRSGQAVNSLLVFDLIQKSQTGNRIALEQLNLLRQHQGLRPITWEEINPPMFGPKISAVIRFICNLVIAVMVAGMLITVAVYFVLIPILMTRGN